MMRALEMDHSLAKAKEMMLEIRRGVGSWNSGILRFVSER